LTSFIEDTLAQEFPAERCACHLTPLLDLTLGDIGSDILKQIAKLRREPPETIASRVLPRIAESKFGRTQIVDGFLNIVLHDQVLKEPLTNLAPVPKPRSILVAPSHRGLDQVGYARVVASAVTHWSLCADSCALISTAGTLPAGARAADVYAWIHGTTTTSFAPPVPDAALNDLIRPVQTGPVVVWLYPDFLSRSRFRELLESLRARVGDNAVHIQCLEREWLTRISDPFEMLQNLLREPTQMLATCLYLARNCSGGDLDLGTPRQHERANMHWSLPTLVGRLDRLFPSQRVGISPPVEESAAPLTPLERKCLARVHLLPLFLDRAIAQGEVANLLNVVEEIVENCTRYLNDPRIRQMLASPAASTSGLAIISGAKRSLSAIIQTCRLFQDPEPVQP
ncbi:MAG: hypothetical protein EBZ48_13435, partial [Proteobacteria bacterium]|nr:hypothetical protein [Pseudomonadota bacterium]